jgi:hypothetical protein
MSRGKPKKILRAREAHAPHETAPAYAYAGMVGRPLRAAAHFVEMTVFKQSF